MAWLSEIVSEEMNHALCLDTYHFVHTSLNGSVNLLASRIRSNGNYRHMLDDFTSPLKLPNPRDAGKSIHDWHFQIHENDGEWLVSRGSIERCGREEAESVEAMICGGDCAAHTAQLLRHDALIDGIVLDNKDMELFAKILIPLNAHLLHCAHLVSYAVSIC